MDIFSAFPTISNHLVDILFRELCALILKVGHFISMEVIEACATFLELHMRLAIYLVKNGFPALLKVPEFILAVGRRQFYQNNSCKVELLYHPFGNGIGNQDGFQQWIETLKEGDLIDAVKFCRHDLRAIWSKATLIEIK